MPFSPVDLSGADDITKVSVNLTWDMDNIVTYNDNHTPQDFSDDFDF
jgi:hypothetical protein